MVQRFRLPNGLTVVFSPADTAHVVAFQLWIKAGSADETADEVGLAHLHEHMLFKGTARRGLGEIARAIEAHGGEINAWTSFDQTVYHVVLASQHARLGLDVLADAVRHSAFDADELKRETEVVCEEIKRSLDLPSRRASKELFANTFHTHPYGRPVIGFEANVRAHTRERVLGFYAKHYRPENIVLTAVGDVTEAQVRAWADELLGGDWGATHAKPSTRPVEPLRTEVEVALKKEDVKEAYLHVAFQLPGVDHPDMPALDVLAMVLGQGDTSRLSLEVRRKRALAKDVNAWAWTPKDAGLFATSLVTTAEQLPEALTETLRVLATIKAAPVADEELATVKALFEAETIYAKETVQGQARKLGFYEAVVGGVEREAKYYEAIAAVTPATLLEVAQKYLRFDRAVVSGLVPTQTALSEADVREALHQAATVTADVAPPRKLPPQQAHTTPRRASSQPGLVVERLPSGATIIVREERAVPIFAMRAAFRGGLLFETEAVNGRAALLARTFTRGVGDLDAEQVSHLVDSLAGSMSAMAGRSSISVRGEFLSKHFEPAFDLFATALRAPRFDDAEVNRERGLLLQDVIAREDRASSVAFDVFAKTLLTAHPYRLNGGGQRESLAALGPEQLHAYHRASMDPSQLTFSVVGDVDADEVLTRARRAFGEARAPVGAPAPVVEPLQTSPREAKKVLDKKQTHLLLGFRGASVHDAWRKPLEVLSTILSGQSGRLFLELRDKRSMAYSVSSSSVEGLEPGWFSVYMATSPDKVPAALEGIRGELKRVQDTLVTSDELARAKALLIGGHEIALQRNTARAGVMALDACYGLGADNFQRYPAEVEAITADDVRDVAQRVIDFQRETLAIVGP